MKRYLLALIILIVIIGGVSFVWYQNTHKLVLTPAVTIGPKYELIGTSVEGRKIEAYTYGNGPKHIVFIGGIHGGYEWNSVLLAYNFMDYLALSTTTVPTGLTVAVIPSANPDGVFKIIGKEGRFALTDVPKGDQSAGRFNAHGVDLNRNFDCKWQPKSTWRGNVVDAGTAAFSEPEAKAMRDFLLKTKPVSVIFWHSQSNTVYASQCGSGVLPETKNIMNLYAKASGYAASETFDSYAISGAAEDWLASINIPAITVELKTHETVEWEQNLAGIKALFNYYASSTRQ
jgi:predicted deacylase